MDARLYSWESDEVSSSKLWPRRRLDLCLSFPTIFVIVSWTTNLISICQGEKFWEVEDDRHEEEGEGVAKASLRTQAELKTVNRFLKFKTNYPPVFISQMDTLPEMSWTLGWWTPPCMWYTSWCPLGHTSWVMVWAQISFLLQMGLGYLLLYW